MNQNIRTIADLPWNAATSFPRPDLLRVKINGRYEGVSSQTFFESVRATALGLHSLKIEKGDRVAILSENSPYWCEAFFGAASLGAWCVPLYSNLPAGQVAAILNDCQARAVFVSTQEQHNKITAERPRLPYLEHVIVRDAQPTSAASDCLWHSDLLARGKALHQTRPDLYQDLLDTILPDDLLELIYTSGTTGEPKGVMLTHASWRHATQCALDLLSLDQHEVHLSFLPLAHIYEQGNHFDLLACGGSIAYAESMETVPQDILQVRPTKLGTVPRMYEKIYEQVMNRLGSAPAGQQRLFRWAMAVGREKAEVQLQGRRTSVWLNLQTWLARRLVYSKILDRLGGRTEVLVSGAAPIAPEVLMFFLSLGVPLLEVYGLTEGLGVTINRRDHIRAGTVGQAYPGVELRIAEDGEVLVRSPMVMKGYYHRPEATAEALRDGWLHTGDIGRLDGDGFLKITDRKKNLIKTSGGKYVAPQAIERILKAIPYVSEAMVVGEGRPFISALVVPNFELIEQYAASQGMSFGSREDLVRDQRVMDFFMSEIDRASSGLARFEKVKKIVLLDHGFSMEAGEVTPTMKLRRQQIGSSYGPLIDELYAGSAS
jgi:long-chain acyl-CoA synthetase